MQLLKYRRTCNLGDAVQSVALARLLPEPPRFVYRDLCLADPNELFIVNGWLGNNQPRPENPNVLFAGIHLAQEKNLPWLRASRFPIGARDPWTQVQLAGHGIESEMIGCATITLPRYDGKRAGIYAVDAEHEGAQRLTHGRDGPWKWQWAQASALLAFYERAELVVTSRLHVALPCLAFGTPVIIHPPKDERRDPRRFSILTALHVRYDTTQTADVSAIAARYRAFLTPPNPIPVPQAASGTPARRVPASRPSPLPRCKSSSR